MLVNLSGALVVIAGGGAKAGQGRHNLVGSKLEAKLWLVQAWGLARAGFGLVLSSVTSLLRGQILCNARSRAEPGLGPGLLGDC